MTDWNAAQYLKFSGERTRPSIDLARRISLQSPQRILDIGCGPGNSTKVLADQFPAAYILGIDNSQNMIDTAKAAYPQLDFQQCDAHTSLACLDGPFDIVFSNACIQWIPDHPRLLREMMALLQPGGVLAVQVPMNSQEPIHQILSRLAASARWAPKLGTPRIFYTLTQSQYFDLLSEIAADFTLWQTTYFHRLDSHKDILEWYRSTGLRPYLQALSPADGTAFEQEIYSALTEAYPTQKNGEIIFRFPRFFFIAEK